MHWCAHQWSAFPQTVRSLNVQIPTADPASLFLFFLSPLYPISILLYYTQVTQPTIIYIYMAQLYIQQLYNKPNELLVFLFWQKTIYYSRSNK